MKYGLIYYKDTENLGDDVLTIAAKKFLPQIDYYIDREAMDEFVPEEKEYVACILNGWYLHSSYTFPPSPYIIPFFVGTHFEADFRTKKHEYIDRSSDYLKNCSPIGCRDLYTARLLEERGINSFFSGCLTLTTVPPRISSEKYDIILNDLADDEVEYIKGLVENKRDIDFTTHRIPSENRGVMWGKEREDRVNRMLDKYANAKLLITSRLHAALPTLAMKTPVILVGKYDEDYYNRIGDFSDYLAVISKDDLFSGKADNLILNDVENKQPEDIITGLKLSCERFIKETMNDSYDKTLLPDICIYKKMYADRIKPFKNHIFLLNDEIRKLINRHNEDVQAMQKMLELAKKLTN